jgi:hypothetical protein
MTFVVCRPGPFYFVRIHLIFVENSSQASLNSLLHFIFYLFVGISNL